MECRPCSRLTAGPLSAAAQRVMAALRAQYAGRIDRAPQSESGLETNKYLCFFCIIGIGKHTNPIPSIHIGLMAAIFVARV